MLTLQSSPQALARFQVSVLVVIILQGNKGLFFQPFPDKKRFQEIFLTWSVLGHLPIPVLIRAQLGVRPRPVLVWVISPLLELWSGVILPELSRLEGRKKGWSPKENQGSATRRGGSSSQVEMTNVLETGPGLGH